MQVADLLAVINGIIGAALWLGIVRAVVRHRENADAVAFVAMVLILLLAFILATMFPSVAIGGIRGALTTLGYLIVLGWFWRSRELAVVKVVNPPASNVRDDNRADRI